MSATPMLPVSYRIAPADVKAHLFEITLVIATPSPQGQRVSLPAWIPGSYMIREFSKNIVEIKASAGERRRKSVPLEKIDKHTWQAGPASGPLTIRYRVYAWDLSVRAAHLDQTHGFFNGTSVFLRVHGLEDQPHSVTIDRATDGSSEGWSVATTLREDKADADGYGIYRAENYDELVDHPVEMGTFSKGQFRAGGADHEIVITGWVPNLDMARLCNDLAKVCQAQCALFEPKRKKAPFGRYLFLIMAVGDGYGGLEHRSSTALLCSRNDLPYHGDAGVSDRYQTFLGLASHEYFHSWNVKRIKPSAFVPYNFDQENYTRLLWLFEGFTSYYDDLMLCRSGLISPQSYLTQIAKARNGVLRGAGRKRQSVAESSWDAWIKYYRQDENSPNAIVSYYQKGSLVGLGLDLTIRAATGGKRSLDDVMRALWIRHGKRFYQTSDPSGLGETEFADLVREATDVTIDRELRDWVYGTEDVPIEALLDEMGVSAKAQKAAQVSLGVKLADGGPRIAQVLDGGSASAAGLSAGDTLVAIDGLRVTGAVDGLLKRYRAGQQVVIHAFRRDELYETLVTLTPEAASDIDLVMPARPGAALRAWLNA